MIAVEPVLCYISGNRAYFTTQALVDQWGDDWNDAPYEHNAGTPYAPCWIDVRDKKPLWEIHSVMFCTDLVTPDYEVLNSEFSVEDINNGEVPWLRPHEESDLTTVVKAGTTLLEFRQLIAETGGCVSLRVEVMRGDVK